MADHVNITWRPEDGWFWTPVAQDDQPLGDPRGPFNSWGEAERDALDRYPATVISSE